MTEIEAKHKLDCLFLTLEQVYERFEGNYWDGREILSTLKEIEVLIHRFLEEVKERNSNG